MLRFIREGLTVIFVAVAAIAAQGAYALPYTAMYVFGDSLSDSGNNAAVFDMLSGSPGTLRTPTPIASPAFVPTYPYASDRYSNGPVWVEQLASHLGVSAAPSALGGTNFAYGGARTGPSGSSFPYSLIDQTSQFLTATGGVAPSSALYVVAGGGNDAFDAFSYASGGGDPTTMIATYASNIATILSELSAAGAHDILLTDVPDIGLTPVIQSLGGAAVAGATGIAEAMNAALDSTLSALVPSLGLHVQVLDVFGLLDQVVADPSAFGLTDATSTCAYVVSCIADPSGTFFWDGIHPTSAGHRVFASAAASLIPEPASLALVALAVIMLAAFARPRRKK